jgi:ribosome-associated protein
VPVTATEESIHLIEIAAQAADEHGGENLIALDVSGPLPLADCFLLVSAASERTVRSIADAVEEALAVEGVRVLHREGRVDARWVLIDFGDIIVHVFHEEDRAYYGLERLWSDCPRIPLEILEGERR